MLLHTTVHHNLYALGNKKICVTHFTVQRSETKPAISPRSACICTLCQLYLNKAEINKNKNKDIPGFSWETGRCRMWRLGCIPTELELNSSHPV